jgi:FKBP-type peptidyl-prolyl cis-trans isomerase FkpA
MECERPTEGLQLMIHPISGAAWRAALLMALCLGASGCGSGDAGGADEASGDGIATEDSAAPLMDMEFADELDIDLDEMTRTESGLYYEELEPGSGLAARDGHVLDTHYTGWLTTGQEFGTSRGGNPYSFQLGRQQVPRGIEEGVTGMRIGGVRRLVVPPSLGFGPRGQPPTIPPSATLVYEIELLDIKL